MGVETLVFGQFEIAVSRGNQVTVPETVKISLAFTILRSEWPLPVVNHTD